MGQSHQHSVLVVDNDPAIPHLCRECLTSETITITVARNVYEARQFLAENQFDLLITDYDMPGLTGIDLILGIRSEGKLIPIILMSGMPSVRDAIERADITNWEFLDKPFYPARLQKLVRGLICSGACCNQTTENEVMPQPGGKARQS